MSKFLMKILNSYPMISLFLTRLWFFLPTYNAAAIQTPMMPRPTSDPYRNKLCIDAAGFPGTLNFTAIAAPVPFADLPPSMSTIPLTLNFASLDVGMYIISLIGLLTAYDAALTTNMTENAAHASMMGVDMPL